MMSQFPTIVSVIKDIAIIIGIVFSLLELKEPISNVKDTIRNETLESKEKLSAQRNDRISKLTKEIEIIKSQRLLSEKEIQASHAVDQYSRNEASIIDIKMKEIQEIKKRQKDLWNSSQ